MACQSAGTDAECANQCSSELIGSMSDCGECLKHRVGSDCLISIEKKIRGVLGKKFGRSLFLMVAGFDGGGRIYECVLVLADVRFVRSRRDCGAS